MIILSEKRYRFLSEEGYGICRSCQEEQPGIEPDGQYVECESCGDYEVFGVEELLIMGEIDFNE